ncbi:MAG: CvpA family protein [Thermomicrobiaceae bacterium]
MVSHVDVYVLLDILLIVLIALFIPIGFWRGAYREAFVTLGILFGASLGRFWGEAWGLELSEVSRLQESGGAFMITMLCLISATFLLGYSAGAAVPVPQPGWIARALGALVAGANGALLLSFALRDIREYLLSSEESGFLDNAVIAPFLSDGTGWILLVAAAVFVPIALVLALFGTDIEEDDYYEDDDYEVYEDDFAPYAQRTMQIDQRAPAQAPRQAPARQEPPRHTTPEAAEAEDTRAVAPVQHRDAPQRPRPDTPPAHAAAASHEVADSVGRPANESGQTEPLRAQPQTPATQEPHREPQSQPSFGTHSVDESTDESESVFGHRRSTDELPAQPQSVPEHACPSCGTDISEADGYCPRCGARI